MAIALVFAAPAQAAIPARCGGDAIKPTQTITGEFASNLEGSYVMVPFDVPAGTTQVRVKYCFDQPEGPTNSQVKHTLDLGLYEPRERTGTAWGLDEFRGWGGSSHPDVTLTAEGFSSEADRRKHVPGKTTRAFKPGPIEPGQWAAELGVAAVATQDEGDSDGKVGWRVEVELRSDAAFADEPYQPAPYDSRPAKAGAGWYAGDMHVHAEHSALGDALMSEVFGFAFGAPPNGAGLDFITLSDYVGGAQWGEIGRHQAAYPGKLIMRSSETITYRGHINAHATPNNVDYRTGPIYGRAPNGALTILTLARSPQHIFDRVHATGGFTQVNHPTIFPSEVPAFESLCRGCPWDYADSETDWRKVDAYEVHTGPAGAPQPAGNEPGPNPFTPAAVEEFDRLRREGYRITGVAVSDSHNAGRTPGGVTQSPIGEGTTVVYAPELSEEGIQKGIEAGHAYMKLFGHESPDLRLTAQAGDQRAMMGDRLAATEGVMFHAEVLGAPTSVQPRTLVVYRDGLPYLTVPVVPGAVFAYSFPSAGAGDYRIQVMRGTAIDALTNPITLGERPEPSPPPGAPPGQGPGPGPPSGSDGEGDGTSPARPAGPTGMRLSVRPKKVRAGKRVRFRFKVLTTGRTPARVAGALVRFGGRRARTDETGIARIAVSHSKTGRKRASASRPGLGKAVTKLRVTAAKKRR